MIITSYFTDSGVPITGLNPSIKIKNINTGTNIVTGTMTDVGDGFYKYDFINFDSNIEYAITANGGALLLNNDRYKFWSGEFMSNETVRSEIDTNSVKLDKLSRLAISSMKIVGTELIAYDEIGEIQKWYLQDESKIPSNDSVFYRIKQ